jgi:hypothetical protein
MLVPHGVATPTLTKYPGAGAVHQKVLAEVATQAQHPVPHNTGVVAPVGRTYPLYDITYVQAAGVVEPVATVVDPHTAHPA